jgi:hypothetical protein
MRGIAFGVYPFIHRSRALPPPARAFLSTNYGYDAAAHRTYGDFRATSNGLRGGRRDCRIESAIARLTVSVTHIEMATPYTFELVGMAEFAAPRKQSPKMRRVTSWRVLIDIDTSSIP